MKTKIIIVMLFLMIANIGFSMSAFHTTTTRIPFHTFTKTIPITEDWNALIIFKS